MPRVKGPANRGNTGIDTKQRKFPHRTHIARQRPSLLGSAKEKRQSSLTQLAFVSTPSTSFDETEVYSDYGDAHFEEPRPRKKQRMSSASDGKAKIESNKKGTAKKLEKGQDTLTQRYDWIPSSAKNDDEIEDDSDDPGFNIYDDEGRDRFAAMVREKQEQRKRQLPWLVDSEATGETPTRRYNLRSPEKAAEASYDSEYISQSTTTNETPMRRYNLRSPVVAQNLSPAANPTAHSIATRDFHTPRKRARLQEIPSSNTPPSAKVYSQRSQRSEKQVSMLQQSPLKPVVRSPLKEKSANIQPRRWVPRSPESQNPTMKALEKVRQRKMAALNKTAVANCEPPPTSVDEETQPVAEAAAKEAMPAPPLPRRTPERITTVQDSQLDDLDVLAQVSVQSPPRKPRRTDTVQDSQYEDLDLSSQIYRTISGESLEAVIETDPHNGEENYDEYDNEENYDNEQYTYDPVSAALDRDAARYGMTQTQAPATLAQNGVADVDDYSEEDDLNVDTIPDSEDEDEVFALSPVRHAKQASQLLSSDFTDPPRVAETRAVLPLSDSPPAEVETSPPSSPPPFHLRPSQVSTVVPTQASPMQQLGIGREEFSPPTSPTHEPMAESFPQRPLPAPSARHLFEKSQGMTQATLSSSPLALPPWSSPERARWVGVQMQTQERGERGNGGQSGWEPLTDFSLPPPPPLTSSAGVGRSSSPWNIER